MTGTVSLNGRAKASGFSVSLRTSLPALPVPLLVTVAQGQASAAFTFTTPITGIVENATITALAGSASETATLEIDPASLARLGAFSVTPASVQGGTSLTGTLGLTAPAALGGVNIQISSDNAAVAPPAIVTIQGNNTSTTFTIPTTTVTTAQTANLTATLGNATLTAQATVVPALQLTLAESSVTGGSSVTATVTLGKAAAASGANITVTSSATSVAQPPATVSIPAGQTTAAFAITTYTVTAARTVTVTVTYAAGGMLSQTAMLTVNPQAAAQLQSLTVSPTTLTGGTSATGTITLTGPAPLGGLIVQLRTSNGLTAQIPFLVTVPQGQTTATFTITTLPVASSQSVTITATAGTVTETATLTVNAN